MAKRNRSARGRGNWGASALVASFVIAGIATYYPMNLLTIILALLGAVIAVLNIKQREETSFMIAIVTYIVVTSIVTSFAPALLVNYMINLAVVFGTAGLVVALGTLIKLGWTN